MCTPANVFDHVSMCVQARALKRLGLVKEATGYCHQESLPGCRLSAAERHIGCNRKKYVTYVWNTPVVRYGEVGGESLCFLNGTAVDYWGPLVSDDLVNPILIKSFDVPTIDAFLTLRYLQAVNIYVQTPSRSDLYAPKPTSGTLPLQLAALTDLKHLAIRYECMTGTLPVAWQWPKLSTLLVGVVKDAPDIVQTPVAANCGIGGRLPENWPQQMPQLRELYLINNALGGTLPDLAPRWPQEGLWLSQNQFSGSISNVFADRGKLKSVVLRSNRLTGGLPSFIYDSGGFGPSAIQTTLERLDLAGNALTGKPLLMWVAALGCRVSTSCNVLCCKQFTAVTFNVMYCIAT